LSRSSFAQLPPIETYVVAQHVTCRCQVALDNQCLLAGTDVLITQLPVVGALLDATDAGQPTNLITESQLPYRLTNGKGRVVFRAPDNYDPSGAWSFANYTLVPDTAEVYVGGNIFFTNHLGLLTSSQFTSGSEGWTIVGNGNMTTPLHMTIAAGMLDRYIAGGDEVSALDPDTGTDRRKWYFVSGSDFVNFAGLRGFLAGAFGGTLRFTIKATYGDWSSTLNRPLDFISLECSKCDYGRGVRLVRFADVSLPWDGTEQVVEVTIGLGHLWRRAVSGGSWPLASQCDIAAVLSALTSVSILGDFTASGEGVGVDNVEIEVAAEHAAFPASCQSGCLCSESDTRSLWCCLGA